MVINWHTISCQSRFRYWQSVWLQNFVEIDYLLNVGAYLGFSKEGGYTKSPGTIWAGSAPAGPGQITPCQGSRIEAHPPETESYLLNSRQILPGNLHVYCMLFKTVRIHKNDEIIEKFFWNNFSILWRWTVICGIGFVALARAMKSNWSKANWPTTNGPNWGTILPTRKTATPF